MKKSGPSSLIPCWPRRYGLTRLLSRWSISHGQTPSSDVGSSSDSLACTSKWLMVLSRKCSNFYPFGLRSFWNLNCVKSEFLGPFSFFFSVLSAPILLSSVPWSIKSPRQTMTVFWRFIHSLNTYLSKARDGPGIMVGVGENDGRCVSAIMEDTQKKCHDVGMLALLKVTQSCLTLCNLMDYTVLGILQARILEWVAFPFSRASSQPRDRAQVSHIGTREALEYWSG